MRENHQKIPSKYIDKINKIKKYKETLKDKTQEELQEIYKSTDKPVIIFAIVDEIFNRILNIQLYDVQLYAALAMSEGRIVEMKTGEGKSFVSILVGMYRHKFEKVYIVTVNNVLAQRDEEMARPLFNYLGISTAATESNNIDEYKYNPETYKNDIIFSDVSKLIFDYLYEKRQFDFGTVIVDEIDYVLLDNATSSFSLTKDSLNLEQKPSLQLHYFWLAKNKKHEFKGEFIPYIAENFFKLQKSEVDYFYFDDYSTIFLTINGHKKAAKIIEENNIEDKNQFYFALFYTLQAESQYKKDRDYIVDKDVRNLILINRNNGRLMPNSHKERGLQEALEIKEDCIHIQSKGATETISMQLFFLLFNFLTGMSGTVDTSKKEFKLNFKSNTSVIPTNLPIKRIDYPDIKALTIEEKYKKALDILTNKKYENSPFLIVFESEQETILFSNFLKEYNIQHKLLNNYNIREENEVINEFSSTNQIVITTNLLGRGTDIKISEEAKNSTGLVVLLMNKFKNKRIEKQIKGRSGRQGQVGVSYCIFSKEDDFFTKMEESYFKKFSRLFKSKRVHSYILKIQNHLLAGEESHRFAVLEIDKILFDFFDRIEKQYVDNCTLDLIFKLSNNQSEEIKISIDNFLKIYNEKILIELFQKIFTDFIFSLKEDLYKQIMDIGLFMSLESLVDSKTDYLFYEYVSPIFKEFEEELINKTFQFVSQAHEE